MGKVRAEFMWVAGSWLITALVALVVFLFAKRRDILDELLVAALILLSARQTYSYLRMRHRESASD
ncbi:MAG TPA: hypothetical protein VMC79_09200 [Rectinemataceae bacterium]|nr:hypothetical protein [Rectinemataceae bacterium]